MEMRLQTGWLAKRSVLLGIAFLVVGCAAVIVYVTFWRPANGASRANSSTSQANATAASRVTALGRIQPAGTVIEVNIPLVDVVDSIAKGVEEGNTVKKGQPLVDLLTRSLREKEKVLAEVQLKETENAGKAVAATFDAQKAAENTRFENAATSAKVNIAILDVLIHSLMKQEEVAKESVKRLSSEAAPAFDHERAKQNLIQVQGELEKAILQRQNAVSMLKLKREEAEDQLIVLEKNAARAQAEIPIETRKGNLSLATERWEQTRVKAPSDGIILKILTHPGEVVGGHQPILQMADLSRMVVIAEVYETQITRVKKKQRATIRSSALAGDMHGTVVRKGRMIARNQTLSLDPTADVDKRVIEVTIELDKADVARASEIINLQVDVEIDTSPPPPGSQ